MSRKQISLKFQLGYPVPVPGFELDLVQFASKLCGGCTSSHKTGWWCEDGAEAKLSFDAVAKSEHTFQIELTCEPHKAANALKAMQYHIALKVKVWAVETAWVHVTETEVIGHHFNVQDLLPTALSDNAMRMEYDAPLADFHTFN